MRRQLLATVGLLLGLAGGAEAQVFTLQPLGEYLLGTRNVARGINNSGQVVGNTVNSEGRGRSFLWTNGTWKIQEPPKGYLYSVGADTNNLGDVVGWGETSSTVSSTIQSLMWIGGGSAQPVVNLSGGRPTEAFSINDSRQITGWMMLADGEHAFLSTLVNGKRKYYDLGPGKGVAINNGGQVLIRSGSENTFSLWTPGALNGVTGTRRILGIAGSQASVGALNDAGQAVFGGYLWQPATASLVSLGVVQQPTYSTETVHAMGINNAGQVVGIQRVVTGSDPNVWEKLPFIWDAAKGMRRIQLNTGPLGPIAGVTAPPMTEITISDPIGDAAWGEIATTISIDSTGQERRAVVLKPAQ